MKIKSYVYGLTAEIKTIEYYKILGYELLAHRYKSSLGEIDIIVKNKETIIFIEVKARNNPLHEEFITFRQIRRYCNAANLFLARNEYKLDLINCRFDLVIVINDKISKIVENAWECET